MDNNKNNFTDPPKTLEEVGLRIDFLRSRGEVGSGTTIGQVAKKVGTTGDRIVASKRFFDSDLGER